MKKRTLLIAMTIAFVAAPMALMGVASAYPGNDVIYSTWTDVPPTIDASWYDWGLENPTYWDPATAPTFDTGWFWGWIRNDATHYYMLYVAIEGDTNPYDMVIMTFDDGNDGVLHRGDEDSQDFYFYGMFWHSDGYWSGSSWWTDDTNDCDAAHAYHDDAFHVVELSFPLNSGDPQDIAASPGDTVGFLAYFCNDRGTFEDEYWWPEGVNWQDATTWGNLVLASEPAASPTPTPSGNETEGCFIATAACGPDDGSVQTLRNFRDSYMKTDPVGQGLVSAYYKLSPPIAQFIDDHPALKPVVRAALVPAVGISEVAVGMGVGVKVAIFSSLALVPALTLVLLRRRARQARA